MTSRFATAMVFITSALVLVIEILAGRLVAPYVGVSLEAFTAIIGTVLAGIALGAAVGGSLADSRDPHTLLGPILILGGVLTWLSVPIVAMMGPLIGSSAPEIVLLTFMAFFAPAAVLSAVSPMVAKLRLGSLEETGSVVGGLSAAGTFGALVGSFLTGFVLVSLVPVRTLIFVIGGLLVLAGLLLWRKMAGRTASAGGAAGIALSAVAMFGFPSACDYETDYFCARVEVDPDRPSGRSLYLDHLRHAYVDLDDPTYLDFRYMRMLADVAEAQPDGPLDVLYIGGGGFSLPRWMSEVRPGSTNEVLEIDDSLVRIAEEELGLTDADGINVTVGDARLVLADLPTDGFDLIIGDAFASDSVPWHLTTVEVVRELDRLLRPGGTYAMNVIDGGSNGYARAQLATLGEEFDHLGVIVPGDEVEPRRRFNLILIASDVPLPEIVVDPGDGEFVGEPAVIDFIGDAQVLTDDFAPVDQLSE